jgi:hypothetical protein
MFDETHLLPDLKNKSKNGGYIKDGYGMTMVRKPNHPNNNNGYVRMNRLMMELYLGRYLEKDESVLNLDGNYNNNFIDNLKLVKRSGIDSIGVSFYTKNIGKREDRTYVYVYSEETKSLFGVENPLDELEYNLATIKELKKQKWASREDFGKVFIVKEGEFLYEGGKYKKID